MTFWKSMRVRAGDCRSLLAWCSQPLPARACRRLSVAADHDDRAVSARRQLRHRDAARRATRLPRASSRPIVIENRPGAAGNVAAMAIKNAPPDGYLLMMGHTGTHAINADALHRFEVRSGQGFPADHGADLVQQHPGRAGREPGEIGRRACRAREDQAGRPELRLAGRRHRRASARRAARQARRHQARSRALSRHRAGGDRHGRGPDGHAVCLLCLASARTSKAGTLRMLAIAGTQRHPRIPDVPTMPEAGFPDVQMQQWFGLFAPAGTARADRAASSTPSSSRRCRATR